jgi:hypothetical protein
MSAALQTPPATPEASPATATFSEALDSGHCPVCAALRHDEFEELCRWVGGNVADANNRRALDAAGGFCNHHIWLLGKIHSPHSGSLLNDFLVARLLRALRDSAVAGEQAAAEWLGRARAKCPICSRLAAREALHVAAVVEWFAEGDGWPRYTASRGLCVPHFARCLALKADAVFRQRLTNALEQQLQRLQTDMREYVRKFDGGLRRTLTRAEANAWAEAAEKLIGRANVWAPDELAPKP